MFGKRDVDWDKMRGLLIERAALDVKNFKTGNERTYLAALLVEQARTNELLEQLVSDRERA